MPDLERSLEREKSIVSWLKAISNDASAVYLLGDVFDFWFEYKTVVPKGFVRFWERLVSLLMLESWFIYFRATMIYGLENI